MCHISKHSIWDCHICHPFRHVSYQNRGQDWASRKTSRETSFLSKSRTGNRLSLHFPHLPSHGGLRASGLQGQIREATPRPLWSSTPGAQPGSALAAHGSQHGHPPKKKKKKNTALEENLRKDQTNRTQAETVARSVLQRLKREPR